MSRPSNGHPAFVTRDEQSHNLLLLMARLFLAAVFLYSGVTKFLNWQGTFEEFAQAGAPMPGLAVPVTIIVQITAGLGVALGWWCRAAAVALALFTVAATLIGHPFWTFEGVAFHRQLTTALEHLAIVGGLLLLAATGPGRYAVGGGRRL